MILKEIQHIFHQELDAIYGKDEVDNFFDMLLNAYFGLGRIDLILNTNLTITKTEEQPLFEALSRLKQDCDRQGPQHVLFALFPSLRHTS